LLRLTADTVKRLGFKENDQFLVKLESTDAYAFSLDIKKNGEPITFLEDMQVTLPYTPNNTSSSILLINDAGEEITQGNLSEAQGLVSFTLNQTGSFTIQERTTNPEPTAPAITGETQFPWVIVIATSLVLALTIVLFMLYRKRGKHE